MNTHSGAGRQSLGIDAGGTRTRWALADADGAIVAEGSVAGWSATQMATPAGRAAAQAVFSALAADVLAAGSPAAGAPAQVCAGLTGFGGQPDVAALIIEWLSGALSIAPHAVQLRSDIEIAYLDSFAPGEGYLVYAGTGSIAAWIAADGAFHRAGGRGVLLDDGGGGYWIAREALRHIWRREDEAPGAWRTSAMARAVFEHIGGDDWSLSRDFMYGRERGAIGALALAVAASADADPQARLILQQAGAELARLALALVSRHGARPIALAGGASTLHPLIAQSMREALSPALSSALSPLMATALSLRQAVLQPHHAAARIALHSAT